MVIEDKIREVGLAHIEGDEMKEWELALVFIGSVILAILWLPVALVLFTIEKVKEVK